MSERARALEQAQIAERIAREAHAGQVDRVNGRPYIEHVERVAGMVSGDEAKAVAWLHDVLEDSDVTPEALEAAGISDRVILAVRHLTRYEPRIYGPYIDRLRAGQLAAQVKIADLRDHLTPSCPESLRPRYEAALALLAVDPPPSGARPVCLCGHSEDAHAMSGLTDCFASTSGDRICQCPKFQPSGASPQAETSANVRALTVHICEDCLNLRGEMCNEPGCRFCRRTMAEVADYLDVLLIRPRIDGVSVLVDEGTPLPAPVSPVEPEPPEELPCYCDIPSHILDLGCPRHQAPQCEPEPPKTWSLERAQKLNEIADRVVVLLFVNGFGEHADRLVMKKSKQEHGDLGGWSRDAVKTVILEVLRQEVR